MAKLYLVLFLNAFLLRGFVESSNIANGEVCGLPAVKGPCRGVIQRYYYNSKEEKCETFIYGGCGGNGNMFKTKNECEKTCGMKKKSCDEICPLLYRPVCGSDGVTYPNLCVMEAKSCDTGKEITVAYEGRCFKRGCMKICTLDYKPVCGSDGKTYSNLCGLEIAACKSDGKISLSHEGECSKQM